MAISFDVSAFRLAFPAYASETDYTDDTLQGYWDSSTCIISDQDYGYLNGTCRTRALNLLTAHIAFLADGIASGDVPSVLSGASIDKINVSLTPPPIKSQFGWWLSTSPYGAELWALLQVKSVGGFYVGGRAERSAFRKVGGYF